MERILKSIKGGANCIKSKDGLNGQAVTTTCRADKDGVVEFNYPIAGPQKARTQRLVQRTLHASSVPSGNKPSSSGSESPRKATNSCSAEK